MFDRNALMLYLIKGHNCRKDKHGNGAARTPDHSSDMRIDLQNLRSWFFYNCKSAELKAK